MVTQSHSNPHPADFSYRTAHGTFGKGKDMGFISWIVVGAIAGLLARRIVPGPDPGRFIVTVLLGMAGASVGGFVVGVVGGSGTTGFNVWSVLVATLGAVVLLYLYGLIARRTA